jgi:hypothetical protein
MAEEWRIVPSAPFVMASSEGRIMVVPFLGKMPNGSPRQYGGQPTFGVWDKVTARFVWAYRGKNFKVARLVCEAFHGPPSDESPVCIHIDENSANNRPSNLKWGTQKENLNGDAFIDYCRARVGEHSPTIKGTRKKLEQQAV